MESVTVGRGGCRVMGKAPIGTSPAAWSSATVGGRERERERVREREMGQNSVLDAGDVHTKASKHLKH